MRLVPAKNCTRAIEPQGSVTLAFTFMVNGPLNAWPDIGHTMDTSGDGLVCARRKPGAPPASKTTRPSAAGNPVCFIHSLLYAGACPAGSNTPHRNLSSGCALMSRFLGQGYVSVGGRRFSERRYGSDGGARGSALRI